MPNMQEYDKRLCAELLDNEVRHREAVIESLYGQMEHTNDQGAIALLQTKVDALEREIDDLEELRSEERITRSSHLASTCTSKRGIGGRIITINHTKPNKGRKD